ncbi:MAG: hypothetical protein ACXWLH_00535 [Candidatus Saccharimonadales bacterium]
MKESERGFSIIESIFVLLILLALVLTGLYIYRRQPAKKPKPLHASSSQTSTYTFKPVPMDTSDLSKWYPGIFEPFKGFTFIQPRNWILKDDKQWSSQPIDGTIKHPDEWNICPCIIFKGTYLFSPHIVLKDLNGKVANKPTGLYSEIVKGAVIRVITTEPYKGGPGNTVDAPCAYFGKYYSDRPSIELSFKKFKACQIGPPANFDEYSFETSTSKMYYRTELTIYKQATSSEKDYYISLTRAMIGSFSLY